MEKSSSNARNEKWYLSRRIDLSMVVELVLLASLILGSWVNLQRQLDRLCRDVDLLLKCQEKFSTRCEDMREEQISMEYRLRRTEELLKTEK